MSALEHDDGDRPGVRLGAVTLDVIELAAYRGRTDRARAAAAARGFALPAFGHATLLARAAAAGVRPDRWLLLLERRAPGEHHAAWSAACDGAAAAIDLSSAVAAFWLQGAGVLELLARGCRLDLAAFAANRATSTSIAQTIVTILHWPDGWLLLGPATLGDHLRQWLESTAEPFGLERRASIALAHLLGARSS